ncbi:phage tail tube protein [Amycolatopsis japonica]|uniref:phage tail tube protein n=1 Tax=Amycolatopsis japonica TaxID=208439 RepID=UPI0037ABC7A7
MAGSNAKEIRVAGSGRILVAPLGTAAPADTAAAWGADWKDLGYTTTDGVKVAKKDKIDPIDTWQSVSPARFVYSDRDLTFKFQMLQLNEDTIPFFFGGGTVAQVGTSGVYKYEMAAEPKFDERMLGVEFTDGNEVKYRLVVARGQVTETEEMALVRTAPLKLGVTYTALAVDEKAPLVTFLMKDPAYSAV